jgi:hypothetical protein
VRRTADLSRTRRKTFGISSNPARKGACEVSSSMEESAFERTTGALAANVPSRDGPFWSAKSIETGRTIDWRGWIARGAQTS